MQHFFQKEFAVVIINLFKTPNFCFKQVFQKLIDSKKLFHKMSFLYWHHKALFQDVEGQFF